MDANIDMNSENLTQGDSEFDYEKFEQEENALKGKNSTGKAEKTADGKPDKPAKSSEMYDWLQCLVSALLFCVIVFSFFLRIIGVIGTSMIPTFHDSDRVLISNLFYEPKNGDVVVLRKESFMEEPIIKRVIATEGQTVEIDFEQGIVYVDGTALVEPYVASPTNNQLDFAGKVTVPENCVFVLGDNRNGSHDSRKAALGCVDERYIIGKVLLRVVPLNKFGVVD